MIYNELMSDFEMDEKDFAADSWSLAVDSSFLQQQKKEVMKQQDVIYGEPRRLPLDFSFFTGSCFLCPSFCQSLPLKTLSPLSPWPLRPLPGIPQVAARLPPFHLQGSIFIPSFNFLSLLFALSMSSTLLGIMETETWRKQFLPSNSL